MTVFNNVNQHCLERIFNLAAEREVMAAEDIFDADGTKLWAKGSAISSALKEKLACRRLRSPLELSLAIEESVTTGIVVDDCLKSLEGNATLLHLAGSKAAQAALSRLRMVNLPGAIRLLLSAAYKGLDQNYRNALHTVCICAGFAAHRNLSAQETETLLVAALLHDLGEIYIDPGHLHGGHEMSIEQWMFVATHPAVGHLVARDIGRMPEAVSTAISHHHERRDGSGYPHMLSGAHISSIGGIIGVADAVAAILSRDDGSAAYRASLALKIVPEEFDREVVNFIEAALRDLAAHATCDEGNCSIRARTVESRLVEGKRRIRDLLGKSPPGLLRETLQMADKVCFNVEKALRATGLEQLILNPDSSEDAFCGEVCLVAREIEWRLRNLARNIHLRLCERGSAEDLALVGHLLQLLDGSRAVAAGDGSSLLQPLIDIFDGDAPMPALAVS